MFAHNVSILLQCLCGDVDSTIVGTDFEVSIIDTETANPMWHATVNAYYADNRLAFLVLLNSQRPIFAEMKPKTADDCTDVLIEVLRESFMPSGVDD